MNPSPVNPAKSSHTVWHQPTITRRHRQESHGHGSAILWFTGLSGAGKSTLAHAVEEELYRRGCRTYVLDGDNIRHGLNSDLGFSDADRQENIRRIGEVAKLFVDAGVVALTAFISPFRADRGRVRSLVPEGDFIEIYCQCPLAACEARDTKGLYQKARRGEIKEFTGISSPYEAPLQPELVVMTGHDSVEACRDVVMSYLEAKKIITKQP